jgi:phosphohistidine swiveling domain-containing protein
MNAPFPPPGRILDFSNQQTAIPEKGLALVGGKGANLARLYQAGFPVPDGFLITTQAYHDFVKENGLEESIFSLLPTTTQPEPDQLEAVSEQIRALFSSGGLPPGLSEELADFYQQMGEPAVAVRSSATAEDLPELSFAGQQDTYLHIVGIEPLRKAVINCWASLWSARAIGYRLRNHIPQAGTALAVVVQRMVESETAGVLFTANPLTGLRSETVIDAAYGLGEALVSGKVEPDHYVVDAAQGKIRGKTLGAKALSIHGQAGGGTIMHEEIRKDRQALSDEKILSLAQMGRKAASLYGLPQDIEWALVGDKFYLLQSRAVTSLFPELEGVPPEPLKLFFSFAAVQGLLDPITPLGRDAVQTLFAMGASLFHIQVTSSTQTVLYTAGERLWVNITSLFRNSTGRKVMDVALEFIEPTVKQALTTLWDEPYLKPERPGISLKAKTQLAGFFLPLARNVLLNLLSPRRRREYIVGNGERLLELMRSRAAAVHGEPRERLGQIADLLPEVAREHLPRTFLLFVSAVAAGMASFNFLRMRAKEIESDSNGPAWSDLVLELTRGLSHNPTTEMDLDLWNVARAIQTDPTTLQEFTQYDVHALASRYQSGAMAQTGQTAVGKFLARYGGRGPGEIDLGRQRWNEDPTHVFEVLSSYLQIDQPGQAPDVVFARGEGAAQSALDRLCAALRKKRGGWIKERQVRFFAGRMRELMGARESPKFFAVRMFGLLRTPLLQAGAELVRTGELQQPDDLFYLSFNEIKEFSVQDPRDWQQIIAGRREANLRETMRRQVPRLLLSDGRAFYEGITSTNHAANMLNGSPVSPGSVEGLVRVVLNPRQANLRPGEILVCPGTDPSWTPLFLSAGGLVMEVGGMMTHGAVVAREYGIPAIVGVDQATRRLHTGQKIRIDGSTGLIQLLDMEEVI